MGEATELETGFNGAPKAARTEIVAASADGVVCPNRICIAKGGQLRMVVQ